MRALTISLAVACAATACTKADDRMIEPGGGGPPGLGGTSTDAAVVATDVGDGGIEFRVCLVSDLRSGAACATTGADGLAVTLGGVTATTAVDGTFSLAPPTGSALTWNVSGMTTAGKTIVTSVEQFGTIGEIPAITTDDYSDLLLDVAAEAAVPAGSGAIVLVSIQASVPEAGVAVTATPALAVQPFYDVNVPPDFDHNSSTKTGAQGTTLIVNVPTPSIALTLTPMTGSDVTPVMLADVPVVDQAITFAYVNMP